MGQTADLCDNSASATPFETRHGFGGRLVWKSFISPENCREEYRTRVASHRLFRWAAPVSRI
jgi:hypothetical protein